MTQSENRSRSALRQGRSRIYSTTYCNHCFSQATKSADTNANTNTTAARNPTSRSIDIERWRTTSLSDASDAQKICLIQIEPMRLDFFNNEIDLLTTRFLQRIADKDIAASAPS
jgi:hypothetical protein